MIDTLGLGIEDGDGAIAQMIDDLFGRARANAADNAAAEISDDALRGMWGNRIGLLGAELQAVALIIHPLAQEPRRFTFA